MTDFKAKMHQIQFRLGLRPRPWGSLQRSPRSPSWIWGATSWQGVGLGWGRGWKGGGEGEGGNVEGGKGEPPSCC